MNKLKNRIKPLKLYKFLKQSSNSQKYVLCIKNIDCIIIINFMKHNIQYKVIYTIVYINQKKNTEIHIPAPIFIILISINYNILISI